ncbi:hypothetical protein FCV25MIE_32082 [Fagus crenata]
MMTATCPNLSDSANVGLSSTSLKDTNILASDLNVGGAHEALAASEFQIREGECRTHYFGHIQLTRTEILRVRHLTSCQHLSFSICPIVEAIICNFRPNSEPLEPNKGLPINPFHTTKESGPNDTPEPILYEIPISQFPIEPKPIETNVQAHYPIEDNPPASYSEPNTLILPHKRKSPISLPETLTKKPKAVSSPPNPNLAHHASINSGRSCNPIFSPQGMYVTKPADISSLSIDQSFSMAEEAGRIMPPPSP